MTPESDSSAAGVNPDPGESRSHRDGEDHHKHDAGDEPHPTGERQARENAEVDPPA
jgi:hypothetical protein